MKKKRGKKKTLSQFKIDTKLIILFVSGENEKQEGSYFDFIVPENR